jgi:hypothetical protein
VWCRPSAGRHLSLNARLIVYCPAAYVAVFRVFAAGVAPFRDI